MVYIHHNAIIGDCCELSPGVKVLGFAIIGNYTQIGGGSIILPKVKVGSNVIIGAGAVVNRDIPDNSMAVGVQARVIKELEPIGL